MPLLDRTGWTATASSYYNAATSPDKVLDGIVVQNSNFWLSDLSNGVNVNFPHWLAVDMGSSLIIDHAKYVPADTRLYYPITWGQPVPTLVRLYVSNLAAPDPTDLGDWTLAGEQLWPDDIRTHFVYSTDAAGNLVDRTCRHFMLVGVHDDRYNSPRSQPHRMACAEVYAGKLAAGDDYKVYWKAHPKQFAILDPDAGGHGITDTLVLALIHPSNLQVAKAICEQRLWSTAPLATVYPEASFWDWDVPAGFSPLTLPVETVSRVIEGAVVNASLLNVSLYYKVSATGATVWITGADIENKILTAAAWSTARAQTFWDKDVAGTEAIDNFIAAHPYGHLTVWGSTSQSTEPDHTVDVGRFNGTDIFYLIVYGAVYSPPPDTGGGDDEEESGIEVGRNTVMLLLDLAPSRGGIS